LNLLSKLGRGAPRLFLSINTPNLTRLWPGPRLTTTPPKRTSSSQDREFWQLAV